MNWKEKYLMWPAIWLVTLTLGLLLFDTLTVMPTYVTTKATIIEVQPNPKQNYINEDMRTLMDYGNGVRGYQPGALGKPGETLTVTVDANKPTSLFGVVAPPGRLWERFK